MAETKTVKLSTNKEIAAAIAEERIFYATVTRIVPEKENQPLTVPVQVPLTVRGSQSVPGLIFADELDMDTESTNYSNLVGMRIPFVVKGVDEEKNVLICSRKGGQKKMKEAMMGSLEKGAVFEGVISGFTNFGAFVEVNGVVGLLRNADYSSDHSRVSERYKIGDHISVKCKSIGKDGRQRISWETVTKYHRTTPFECDLEAGALVLGRVIDIKNLPMSLAVFVRLEENKGLDVLCSMPTELEIEKGVSVVVRVTSVDPGETEFARPRLRGRIMRLA